MGEDLIHLRFPDNFGRAWIELLESDLSEHARICYVAMTSFGRESRAGKESIRRRMGVKSLSTVKDAQAELLEAGWIKRKIMGGGKTPTEWDVFQRPFDGQLPLLGSETPEHSATRAHSAPPPPAQRPTPGRTAAPKQEDKHEAKQEKLHGKHPDQDAFWESAKASFSKKHLGAGLGWPRDAKNFNKNLTAELERLGGVELARRWDNMVNDPWATASLRNFILETDKWISLRQKNSGVQNGRTFVQPTTDWKPREQTGGN